MTSLSKMIFFFSSNKTKINIKKLTDVPFLMFMYRPPLFTDSYFFIRIASDVLQLINSLVIFFIFYKSARVICYTLLPLEITLVPQLSMSEKFQSALDP